MKILLDSNGYVEQWIWEDDSVGSISESEITVEKPKGLSIEYWMKNFKKYKYIDGALIFDAEKQEDSIKKSVEEQISDLKKLLSSTDYKVIKCSECLLLGIELPYDVAELHAQRQALRDKINELET